MVYKFTDLKILRPLKAELEQTQSGTNKLSHKELKEKIKTLKEETGIPEKTINEFLKEILKKALISDFNAKPKQQQQQNQNRNQNQNRGGQNQGQQNPAGQPQNPHQNRGSRRTP